MNSLRIPEVPVPVPPVPVPVPVPPVPVLIGSSFRFPVGFPAFLQTKTKKQVMYVDLRQQIMHINSHRVPNVIW